MIEAAAVRLTRLSTSGFRNLSPAILDVDAPLVAFVGPNGQGKTNLLEAIGVLGALRSFRTTRPAEMIAFGESAATVEGVGEGGGLTRSWRWALAEGSRRLTRDGRVVEPTAWLTSLRATWFVPSDTALLRGEPGLRRSLLDRAVFTVEPTFLSAAQGFRRVLTQKAALLRTPGRHDDQRDAQLDAIDQQLATLGAAISAARSRVVGEMAQRFQRFYEEFSPGEAVSVRHRAALGEGEEAEIARSYGASLSDYRAREVAAGRPLVGPQRDDLLFLLGDQPARLYASQGQVRSMVLAWKLSELDAARQDGETPLFLLDDLGSELDPGRTRRLVALLGTLGAQVFLTTTDARYLPEGVEGRVWNVVGGSVGESEGG